MKKVLKRNGTKEDFNILKIRKKIEPAFEGTSENPLEFESSIHINIAQDIKSTDIQENLILLAKNNISDEHPDFDIIAGRLMADSMTREVWKNTKIDYENFDEHLDYLIRNNYYRSDIKNWYSEEDIKELSKSLDYKRDYNLRLSQAALLKSKHLIKNKKGILEYPSTADMTNSMILASIEKESNRIPISKEYYEMLSTYVISLATPFKMNLRIPNGNTGSCFIGEMPDNTPGIFKSYTDMAYISQEGGGIGWYLGKVRPGDAYSQKVPKANKINRWIKIINDIAVAVNQRGVRNGAITPALDWWHLDIIDFMEIKSELNGDLRDKCFDIYPQVVFDDYLVNAYFNNEDVYLFDQYEFKNLTNIDITELIGEELINAHLKVKELIETGKLKHYNKVSAKSIVKKSYWSWVEYGDFYITHKDNLNISNYMSEYGIAKCGNLCMTGDTMIDVIIDGEESSKRLDELEELIKTKEVLVKSYNIDTNEIEYKQAYEFLNMGETDDLYEIEDEKGNIITCTSNHKIYTKNRGYIEAKDILETDILVSFYV